MHYDKPRSITHSLPLAPSLSLSMRGTHWPYIFGAAIALPGRLVVSPSVRPSLCDGDPPLPSSCCSSSSSVHCHCPRMSEQANRAWEIHQIARMGGQASRRARAPLALFTGAPFGDGDWPIAVVAGHTGRLNNEHYAGSA